MRVYGRRDGESFQDILPIHKCTAEDMEEFYPIATQWQRSYNNRKVNGIYSSFCVDWSNVDIQAKSSATSYSKFEVIFAPCNYMHTSYGYKDEPVSAECVRDLEKQKAYLDGS